MRGSVVSSDSAFELGRAPLMTTLPAAPAKPRMSRVAEVELEARHPPGDVERAARRILGEESGVVDGRAAGCWRRRGQGLAPAARPLESCAAAKSGMASASAATEACHNRATTTFPFCFAPG